MKVVTSPTTLPGRPDGAQVLEPVSHSRSLELATGSSVFHPSCTKMLSLLTTAIVISQIRDLGGEVPLVFMEVNSSTRAELSAGSCIYQVNQPCYSNSKIKFELYTNNSGDMPFTLDLRRNQVPTDFNPYLPLKVVIHGFGARDHVDGIVNAYKEKSGYNVLAVDWEELSMRPCYFTAALNTRQVARCTGIAVASLRPKGYVHIVGFSLGAHIAGHTSQFMTEHLGRRANRISGLDPALPLYATPIDAKKLDRSDADFVDVIHTSVGIFGKLEPSGHSDFYVNGVAIQPGCYFYQVGNPALCSHGRATMLFAESIRNPDSFQGTPCPSFWYYVSGFCSTRVWQLTARMGDRADPKARGIYLVQTTDYPPYTIDSTEPY